MALTKRQSHFYVIIIILLVQVRSGLEILTPLLGVSSILAFTKSTVIRDILLSLFVFLTIYPFNFRMTKMFAIDDSIVSALRASTYKGHTYLDSQNMYIAWVVVLHKCAITIAFGIFNGSIIIYLLTQLEDIFEIYSLSLYLLGMVSHMVVAILYLIVSWRPLSYKFYILKLLMQDGRLEHWNFQIIDEIIEMRGEAKSYRAVVLTNDAKNPKESEREFRDRIAKGVRKDILHAVTTENPAQKESLFNHSSEPLSNESCVEMPELRGGKHTLCMIEEEICEKRLEEQMGILANNWRIGAIELATDLMVMLVTVVLASSVVKCQATGFDLVGWNCAATNLHEV